MDNEKLNNIDNVDEDNLITLTDENGEEVEFEIITDYEKDGNRYFAMFPPESDNDDSDIVEYVILKLAVDEETGEEYFVSIEDDDELDDVADYFDDLFSAEMDYDN